MKKNWIIRRPASDLARALVRDLKCHPVIGTILVNRGVRSVEGARAFLRPSLGQMGDPGSMAGMDAAVDRVRTAIYEKEKILIFGDYDVDGVTATAAMYEFLRCAGADVSYYIPHRTREGYGLKPDHITKRAEFKDVKLLITVDCGSSSHLAVKTARDAGMDVVVTDHHQMEGDPPEACALLNPAGSGRDPGLEDLAGVGVAFYLIICLRKRLREDNFWSKRPEPNLKRICDLVALGVIGDMVPLQGVNRVLTRAGLEIINSGRRVGLKALLDVSEIRNRAALADDIAFRLAPRINAAGRMDHAGIGVELLTTDDPEAARRMALSLDEFNAARKETEQKTLDGVLKHLDAHPRLLGRRSLVLANPRWHEGVLGIVASRLARRYYRPVALIAINNGVGKGSARSIPGLNLFQCISACAGDLMNFGGHKMAAGLTLKMENIERFWTRFDHAVLEKTRAEDFTPTISIDEEIGFDDVSDRLLNELESLAPFGTGNPEPMFMAKQLRVHHQKIVGAHHRRLVLAQPSARTDKTFLAIHFNVPPGSAAPSRIKEAAFRLRWNRWNGQKKAQLVIEDM
ncbi:MAG: single-stranded-DNA-specific exonuclease RecJ [Desulfobacterales bacterium]|nr:single-stranded-DNA-specific exonuclease RecJ [Desulfobacterales bacterium]